MVSIGLPVFNGERYLAKAIDALLSQSYTDFEIVVSDNGSRDGTASIIKEYCKRDPRIVPHYQQTNIGAINNFQYVLRKARGEYFMWAAHDDLWQENYLEALVATLDKNPNVSLAFAQYAMIDEQSKIFQYGRNNLFKSKAFTVNPDHLPEINSLIYYLDRNPFKYYGLYRRIDVMSIPHKMFLGSPQNAENVFLAHFLARYLSKESKETTFLYRVPETPKYPREIADNPNYVEVSQIGIEIEFYRRMVGIFMQRKTPRGMVFTALLTILFPLAILKRPALRLYYGGQRIQRDIRSSIARYSSETKMGDKE